MQGAGCHLEGEERQGRQKSDARERREEDEPGYRGPVGERERVAGIEGARNEHEDVADIERHRAQDVQVPLRRDDRNAHDRDRHPHDLHQEHARLEEEDTADQHKYRDRTLKDRDVDRGGVMRGDIKKRVESREAEGGHPQQRRPAGDEFRPFFSNLPSHEIAEDHHHDDPAQACQRHGRDLADRKSSGDAVAGPHQGGQAKQEIAALRKAAPDPPQQPHRQIIVAGNADKSQVMNPRRPCRPGSFR